MQLNKYCLYCINNNRKYCNTYIKTLLNPKLADNLTYKYLTKFKKAKTSLIKAWENLLSVNQEIMLTKIYKVKSANYKKMLYLRLVIVMKIFIRILMYLY